MICVGVRGVGGGDGEGGRFHLLVSFSVVVTFPQGKVQETHFLRAAINLKPVRIFSLNFFRFYKL